MENKREKVSFETISDRGVGQRIDNYLITLLKGVPKSKIYQIIRKGEIRVNKKRVKPSAKLTSGDEIRIPPIRTSATKELDPKHYSHKIDILNQAILFEDKNIIVFNKPSGMAVHGGSGLSSGLIELVRASRPQEKNLELVHRLDKDTSGCIIVSKKASVLKELHRLMADKEITKKYLAVLHKVWKGSEHKVNAPLLKNTLKSGERVVRISPEGKEAETIFSIKQQFKDSTLVEANLITGRTHQIRVHAQFSGHAILGDVKYGFEKTNSKCKQLGLKRMCLHAHKLIIPLSQYEKPLSIEAPLDDNLKAFIKLMSEESRELFL